MQQTPSFPACMGWFNYTRGGEKRGEKDDRQIVKMYKKTPFFVSSFFWGENKGGTQDGKFPRIFSNIYLEEEKIVGSPKKCFSGQKNQVEDFCRQR